MICSDYEREKDLFTLYLETGDKEFINEPIETGLSCIDNSIGGITNGKLYTIKVETTPDSTKSNMDLEILKYIADRENETHYFSLTSSYKDIIKNFWVLYQVDYLVDEYSLNSGEIDAYFEYISNDCYNCDIRDDCTDFEIDIDIDDELIEIFEHTSEETDEYVESRLEDIKEYAYVYTPDNMQAEVLDVNYIENVIMNKTSVGIEPVVLLDFSSLLMTNKNDKNTEKLNDMIISLKIMAVKYNVPIVLFCSYLKNDLINDDNVGSEIIEYNSDFSANCRMAKQDEFKSFLREILDVFNEDEESCNAALYEFIHSIHGNNEVFADEIIEKIHEIRETGDIENLDISVGMKKFVITKK